MKRNWKDISEFNDSYFESVIRHNSKYWECTKFLKVSEKNMLHDFKPLGLYIKFCDKLFDHMYLLKSEKTLYLISGSYYPLSESDYEIIKFIANQLFHKITLFNSCGYETIFALQIGKRISKTTFINNYSTLNEYKPIKGM